MRTIGLSLLLVALAVSGCSKTEAANDGPQGLPKLFAAPAFTLTDENNQPFGTEQLKGKVWIATLFYTTCPGPCPMMSARLRRIQEAVQNPDVLQVSVSVDPEHDSPAAMKNYAERLNADTRRWYFLTGGLAETQKVADGLRLGYSPVAPGQPLMHATIFLLFDRDLQCRGIYHTEDESEMRKIAEDAKTLAAG